MKIILAINNSILYNKIRLKYTHSTYTYSIHNTHTHIVYT